MAPLKDRNVRNTIFSSVQCYTSCSFCKSYTQNQIYGEFLYRTKLIRSAIEQKNVVQNIRLVSKYKSVKYLQK